MEEPPQQSARILPDWCIVNVAEECRGEGVGGVKTVCRIGRSRPRDDLRQPARDVRRHVLHGREIAFAGAAANEAPLATFGRIRSTVTSARQVQLGARIVF